METHDKLQYLRSLKAGVFTVEELHKIMIWQVHNLHPWEYEEYAVYIDKIYKRVKDEQSQNNAESNGG